MLFYFVAAAWFLIVIFQDVYSDSFLGRCRSALQVTDDGPATLDVPIKVTAQLDCADNETKLLYVFEDDIQRKFHVVGHESATATFLFSDGLGTRSVKVTAYLLYPPGFEVATGKTSFKVQEYLPGTLNFSGIVQDKNGRRYVGTGWNTNISLQLHVPSWLLEQSEFAYSWTIGEDHINTDQPFIIHNFTDTGLQWVRVAVVGRIPTYDSEENFQYKWGYFDKDVTVKEPFSNINISGNTYLEHGQLLDLDISCNGSGPIEYCWKVLPQTEYRTNLTCTDPVIGAGCSFPILYYFRDSGDFRLAIYVNNIITSMQRNIEVHIYDVSLRPQLSTVIIPVICTVLVVVIIAVSLVMHMRRHTNYDIETADFDFMKLEESSKLAVETSWEVMRRSVLHLLQIHRLCYSSETAATPAANYGTILVGMEK